MITIKEENILDATEDIIVQQVNCFTMGSGVAKAIYKKYPNVKIEHAKMIQQLGNVRCLGKRQYVTVEDGKIICNIFGQFNYGYDKKQYTDYNALRNALESLYLDLILQDGIIYNKTVAMPYKISSDRGGADWAVVYKMIEDIFGEYNVTLYKYNPKPNLK